jgi:methylmalonyl-CoA epimerase
MKPYNLDHVAIAVHDLDEAIDRHRDLFGTEPLWREQVAEQGVEEAMIAIGGSFVQLIAPLADETPVGRFLAKYGEGLHHVAYAVPDIDAALDKLRAEGARLVDETPRLGGRGAKIAFVHPATFAGTLVELVELADE